MKLIILGSGTPISGLPGIPDRFPPGFLLKLKNKMILFECSEGIRFRLNKMGVEYTDVEHICLSHPHPDHFALVHFIQSVYVKGLWTDNRFKRNRLNIYGPKQIKDNFFSLWNYHFPEHKNRTFEFPRLIFKVMGDGDKRKIGQVILKTKKMHHGFGQVEVMGFRVESKEGIFAYSAETAWGKNIEKLAHQADIFLCESTAPIQKEYPDYGHLNPYQAGLIAKKAQVKKLVLFHYYGIDSNQAILKDCRRSGFKGKIILAKDFQTIEK